MSAPSASGYLEAWAALIEYAEKKGVHMGSVEEEVVKIRASGDPEGIALCDAYEKAWTVYSAGYLAWKEGKA